MQRFSQRESVLLGYSPQKTFMDSSSAPKTPGRNSDIDFNDVFGGPPRRSSNQETRYSFGENTDSSSSFRRSDETIAESRNPWSGLSDKPVFGEEGMSRRRYSKKDFFDDIFRGNESLSSSPRKYEMKGPFTPGSQLLSPARPLPPNAEPFGSSFPAQFRFCFHFFLAFILLYYWTIPKTNLEIYEMCHKSLLIHMLYPLISY